MFLPVAVDLLPEVAAKQVARWDGHLNVVQYEVMIQCEKVYQAWSARKLWHLATNEGGAFIHFEQNYVVSWSVDYCRKSKDTSGLIYGKGKLHHNYNSSKKVSLYFDKIILSCSRTFERMVLWCFSAAIWDRSCFGEPISQLQTLAWLQKMLNKNERFFPITSRKQQRTFCNNISQSNRHLVPQHRFSVVFFNIYPAVQYLLASQLFVESATTLLRVFL